MGWKGCLGARGWARRVSGGVEGVGCLAGDLHGLRAGLGVQHAHGAALQQAVEVVAAAAALHGGDAGGGGGAGAGQAGHAY